MIRPALEPALVDNRVNLVLSGHEHLYEHIRPQQRIQYFVSGGGGEYLYVRPSEFDEVGHSDHHFMVAELAGDRLLFAAISHAQKVIDCGLLNRTQEAAAKSSTIRSPTGWPTAMTGAWPSAHDAASVAHCGVPAAASESRRSMLTRAVRGSVGCVVDVVDAVGRLARAAGTCSSSRCRCRPR